MRLIVSRSAVADLERLHSFLAGKNRTAAQQALQTLEEAIQSLTFLPERGRPAGIEGVRELVAPFGQSAYVMRYAYLPGSDELVVLRIWHGREQRE